MKVIQLLPTVSYGDAVSNDALALNRVIRSMGLQTTVCAETAGKNLPVKNIRELNEISAEDILIYHMSTGTDLNFSLQRLSCRKMMIYHNITPPEFFRPYSREMFSLTSYGYRGLEYLNKTFNYCLADSEYNKSQLIKYDYHCPIEVRPVLIPFKDYRKPYDQYITKKYNDGWTNIIFVGRIAPNKKQEDIIKTFYYYKKINPKSRLILVGSWNGMENYYERLKNYVKILKLNDVIFTGHVTFSEILAYYRVADIFLCMSRHEGFCVPLAEAMFFNVPVVALNAGAVPETLGGSGVLLPDSDPAHAVETVNRIINDDIFRQNIIKNQQKRLSDFSYKKTSRLFKKILTGFINGE
ncbi:MAG: glycosyltransferase [Ruminococcus flavefaciens]|nr:glycosyltransferase [Ruminococcus flavefaciens]